MGDYLMGRYDNRIKVYYQNDWYPINRLRVCVNNSWQDLGLNDSYNTNELYVINANKENKRITRDRVDTARTVTTGLGYQQRETSLNTLQQYCFNYRPAPTNTGVKKTKFHAIMYVKLAAGQSSRLFSFWTTGYFSFYAGVKSDGTVYYDLKDEYFAASSSPWDNNCANTKIAVGFNQPWQKIEFIGDVGSDTLTIKVNDNATNFTRHTAWDAASWGGSSGYVGGPNLRIAKDNEHAFEISTANSPFTKLVEETTTTTEYDTSWV